METVAKINKLEMERLKIMNEIDLVKGQTEVNIREAGRLRTLNQQLKLQLQQLRTISNVYSKPSGQAITNIREFMSAIGTLIGGKKIPIGGTR